MADVILFRPIPDPLSSYVYCAPWSSLYAASFLVKEGYDVKIIDEWTEPVKWKDILIKDLKKNPICAGASVLTGYPIKGSLEFSKIVKENSDIPVVWGGTHPSIFPEQTLEDPLIDIVVKGEGEITFLELVKNLEKDKNLSGIKGVWYKKDGKIIPNPDREPIDINTIEVPYHLINVEDYILKHGKKVRESERSFDVFSSRGCPHRCAFCYRLDRGWRPLKAERVVKEIAFLAEKYKIDAISFKDDNFFVDAKRVGEICNGLTKGKTDIKWRSNCRANYFAKYSDEFIDVLVKSGCTKVTFGIETGSPKIMELINKDVTYDDVMKTSEKMKKHNIDVGYYFVVGFPHETKEDMVLTYKLMKKLLDENKSAETYLFRYTPYPGTTFYEETIKLGFEPPKTLRGWTKHEFDKLKTPWLSKKDLVFLERSQSIIKAQRRFKSFVDAWFRFRFGLIVNHGFVGPVIEHKVYNKTKSVMNKIKKLTLNV